MRVFGWVRPRLPGSLWYPDDTGHGGGNCHVNTGCGVLLEEGRAHGRKRVSLTIWYYGRRTPAVPMGHTLSAALARGEGVNQRIIGQGPCSQEESD